jgi:hypothetical protein
MEERDQEATMTVCTTRVIGAPGDICGKPAVYTEGEFAECAECIKHPASMYATRHIGRAGYGVKVGDTVDVRRHGKVYAGRVVRIGPRSGKVFAEVTYGSGATRVVEVD